METYNFFMKVPEKRMSTVSRVFLNCKSRFRDIPRRLTSGGHIQLVRFRKHRALHHLLASLWSIATHKLVRMIPYLKIYSRTSSQSNMTHTFCSTLGSSDKVACLFWTKQTGVDSRQWIMASRESFLSMTRSGMDFLIRLWSCVNQNVLDGIN